MNGNEKPVFVKIDEYKQVLDTLGLIRKNVAEAKKVFSELAAIKDQEDAELQTWGTNLDEIEAKLGEIDKMMVDPGRW
ncbi:TPA: hypothetical protein HA281_00635 [Candidatus Woesearchaeota archaeon]|nr:MAG: hypothetical protein QT04_C0059G0006 [archaeon GW2011_AR11]MBS3111566.1 hypothetical protein [Candidatus Woesearchaeota archaeon]HIH05103.1 hypothetical protein [Candidatus Woesearchaeota archaeon]HIH91286.1 hypothetical protein [Candidatus Woesearchaeota archaeon]HII64093.1 hypothetical protein [Candidatus Woesearchaeota archaeon]